MLNLTRPRYVFPFHGDHKRISLHAGLAEVGRRRPRRHLQGPQRRCRSRSPRTGAKFGKDLDAGMIFVDGVEIGDPDDVALRDRRMLSADGIFIVVATVSSTTARRWPTRRSSSAGCRSSRTTSRTSSSTSCATSSSARSARPPTRASRDPILLEEDLHDDVAEFVYERLRRRPMVLPVVVEV